MSTGRELDPRWKAALAAAVLFLAGAVAGVAGDRVWLGRWPSSAEAAPLTPDAMSRALDLDPGQRARVRSVLDSIRIEMSQALENGPDSLRTVAQRGQERLQQALPPDRREQFRTWIQWHHARMMQRMGGGMMGPRGGRGPGMGPGGGMGPGPMRRGPGGMMGTDSPMGGRGGMMGSDSGAGGRGGMMGGGATRADSAGGGPRR